MITVIINIIFSPTLLMHCPSCVEKWCCGMQSHLPSRHWAKLPSRIKHCPLSSHGPRQFESVNGIPSWFYFNHTDSKCLITQYALHKYLCYVH